MCIRDRFRKDAMIDLSTGKRSTFVSTKPRPDVWLIIGCLPKDYDPKRGVCLKTTVHKKIKKISDTEARRLKAANPQLMIISNPCPEACILMRKQPSRRRPSDPTQCLTPGKKNRSRGQGRGLGIGRGRGPVGVPVGRKSFSKRKPKARNKAVRPRTVCQKVKPSLMKVKPRKNLMVSSNDVSRARRAFKRFHFVAPAKVTSGNVPNGFEDAYMVIGELERFDVKTPSGVTVSRKYKANRPRLCTTANMKDIFVFAGSKLGIPAGNAMRCDYRVPAHSGRNKWSKRWWHPHDTHPKVLPHRGGCAVRVSGSGLKVTPRGIEG